MIFDELNKLTQERINGVNLKDKREVEDTIYDLLVMAYAFGEDYADEILGIEKNTDYEKMGDSILKKTKGENYKDRVEKWLKTENTDLKNDFQRIVETEATRVYNEAILDTAKASGMNVKKRWKTMEDESVRDTHFYLDNVTIGLEEEFLTFDGDSALTPGGFTLAQNNCNCRCVIELVKEP